jgi:hypothetical protein
MGDRKDQAELPIDYILVQTILLFPRSDVSIDDGLLCLLVEGRDYRVGTSIQVVIVIFGFGVFEVDWNFQCLKMGTDRWASGVADLDPRIDTQESRYSWKGR